MESIRGVRAAAQVAGGTRQAPAAGGFRVPLARMAAAGPAAGVGEVGLGGMLALQEMPGGEVADREARRRGRELLDVLAEMQRELLGMGGLEPARLARLVAAVPVADDPALRGVVTAITLRVRIEMARREGVHGVATEGNAETLL